jgi:hypothetical protein
VSGILVGIMSRGLLRAMFLRPLAILVVSFLVLGASVVPALATDPPPTPEGRVILNVTGQIGRTNDGEAMVFDRAMFDALPQTTVVTPTAWTEGTPTFSGVTLADLLDAVEAEGRVLRVTALNDYAADIPVEEVRSYPILLASRIDGQTMSVRDKGPLWVIYPIGDYPELEGGESDAKMVWQVETIEVRDSP